MSEHNAAYFSYFETELKAERDRKSALDTRGSGLVTASASLTALLTGVGALLKAGSSPTTPGFVSPLVIMSLIFFVFAALCGIAVQWNWRYPVTDTNGLRQMLDDRWQDPEARSRRTVARITIGTIDRLRIGNNWKERFLRAGYVAQVLALAFLTPVAFTLIAAR